MSFTSCTNIITKLIAKKLVPIEDDVLSFVIFSTHSSAASAEL
jgi:hypothetical protein